MTKGPPPKRESERIRRNKTEPVDHVEMIGDVEVPPLELEDPHPIAVAWYESLKESGQARYYEPSDWQYARIVAWTLDSFLKAKKVSAFMFQALNAAMGSELLVAEGSRRKVRMEVERSAAGASDENVVDVAQMFRDRMTGTD